MVVNTVFSILRANTEKKKMMIMVMVTFAVGVKLCSNIDVNILAQG